MTVTDRIAERIVREGPIPFHAFMELALYDPDGGFFASGHGAGRKDSDFVTSPEVGPLFGALVAQDIDMRWQALECPDPFVVVEAGAGRGRLAYAVLRANPVCAPALRYVLTERAEALRDLQREHLSLEPYENVFGPVVRTDDGEEFVAVLGTGPIATSLDELPVNIPTGVVFANELLDNLPFRIVERTANGWNEIRIGMDADKFTEVVVPAPDDVVSECEDFLSDAPVGARLPLQVGIHDWLHEVSANLKHGFVVLIDYAGSIKELAARGQDGWLRTYREHQRGSDPLNNPGTQDITCDVVREFLEHAAHDVGLELLGTLSQANWLATLGVAERVEEGNIVWEQRAAIGDLEAIEARSRASEAAALVDPNGLGAHQVFVFKK